MRGYKFMESDMTCRGFQYEIGKEYSLKDELMICRNGFHFCENPFDCLEYYDNIEGDKRLFLVEATGDVIRTDDKSVTNKIKIIEEIKNIVIRLIGIVFQHIKHYQKNLLKNIVIKLIGMIFQHIKNYQKVLLKNIMIKLIGMIFQHIKNYQKILLRNIVMRLIGIGFQYIKHYQKNLLKNMVIN